LFTCNRRVCHLDGGSLNLLTVRHRCWKPTSFCRTTKQPSKSYTKRTYGRCRPDRWSYRSRCVRFGTVPSAVWLVGTHFEVAQCASGIDTVDCAGSRRLTVVGMYRTVANQPCRIVHWYFRPITYKCNANRRRVTRAKPLKYCSIITSRIHIIEENHNDQGLL